MSASLVSAVAAFFLSASVFVGPAEAVTGVVVDCKPALKVDLYKPQGTPNLSSQAFPSQAVTAAIFLWIQQATAKFGAAYADWAKAQSKSTGYNECGLGASSGDPDYCGWARGTPCRHRPVSSGTNAPVRMPHNPSVLRPQFRVAPQVAPRIAPVR